MKMKQEAIRKEQQREKEWHIWTLLESEIDYHAEYLKVTLSDCEKEDVSRYFRKAMQWGSEDCMTNGSSTRLKR